MNSSDANQRQDVPAAGCQSRPSTESSRQSQRARQILAPYATLKKLFQDGLPDWLLSHDDCSTTVYGSGRRFATEYSVRKLTECYVVLGLSCGDTKRQRVVTKAPFRQPHRAESRLALQPPGYTSFFESIEAFLSQSAFSESALEFLSQPGNEQQKGLMKLVSALKSNLTEFRDEAPLLRCISLLLSIAPENEILGSNTLFPRFGFDADLAKPVRGWMNKDPPTGVSCQIMSTDLNSFMLLRSRHYSLKGWGGLDLEGVTVIPYELHERGTLELIAKILIYTDTIWWAGRTMLEAPIKSFKSNCTANDALYFTHMASLTRIPSRNCDASFKILLVQLEPVKDCSPSSLPTPDGREIVIPEYTPRESDTSKPYNYNEVPTDATFANPMDITGLLTEWLDYPNWSDLHWSAGQVMRTLLEHNVQNSAQSAILLAAELFGYVPMEKVCNNGATPSDDDTAFGCFKWSEYSDEGLNAEINSKHKISPQLTLKTELNNANWEKLDAALTWMGLAHHSPLGLPSPGMANINIDLDAHSVSVNYSGTDQLYVYQYYEADHLSRLATFLRPLVKLSPHSSPLAGGTGSVQYMQSASSLLAGLGGWMAFSAGYTIFDISCFSTSSTSSYSDRRTTLSEEVYNQFIADPISLSTEFKVKFKYARISKYVRRLNVNAMIAALPAKGWQPAITMYDGWPLPGWYVAALHSKFGENTIKLSEISQREIGLEIFPLETDAIVLNEFSRQMDLLILTNVEDVTSLVAATIQPLDDVLSMAFQRFEFTSWTHCRTSEESRVHNEDLDQFCEPPPSPEATLYLLPFLRKVELPHNYSAINTRPIRFYIIKTDVEPSSYGPALTVQTQFPHPPPNWLHSFMSKIVPKKVSRSLNEIASNWSGPLASRASSLAQLTSFAP